MHALLGIDEAIFFWLNGWVGRFPALDAVVRVTVSDYFIPTISSLALLGTWFSGRDAVDRNKRQRGVACALVAVGFASLAVATVNRFYFRSRPFVDYEVALLFYRPTDSSFPAHPAAVAFAIASGMFQGNRLLGGALFVLAALWGLSRVYAGVLYPMDALAGAAIGVTASVAARGFLWSLEPAPTYLLGIFRRLHLA